MGNVNYTATVGYKLLGNEAGAWLSEVTAGNATGAGVSTDLSGNLTDLDATGTVVKSAVATGAELQGWGSFDTSNYLSRAYGADLDLTSALTIAGWIKTATITGTQGIAGNLSAGASGDRGGYGLRIVSSKLEFAVSDGTGTLTQATETADLATDQWVFVVGTLSSAGAMILYRNGQAVASASSASIDATAELFQVGVETAAGVPANAFSGDVSALKVFPVVLTPAQIRALYNAERDLFKPYAIYTRVGVAYDLAISLTAATLSESVQSFPAVSLSGRQETTFHRRDTYYQLNINRLSASTLPPLRSFLHSVEKGETFTLDRYGSAAVPDDPVSVIAEPGFTEQRSGFDDYYTVSMKVREVA